MKAEVYVNRDKSLSDLQTLIKHSILLYFPHELLMRFLKYVKKFAADLYPIYKLSPSVRVCISDKDRLLMF